MGSEAIHRAMRLDGNRYPQPPDGRSRLPAERAKLPPDKEHALTCFEVRPPCPKCGMNMVKNDARFECLRCGHVEKPVVPKAVVRLDA
jgi:ribosomal protein S27AE